MVGLSDWLYRRCQPRLGQLTEKLAIALALFSLAVGSLDLTVLALCLIVITLTLLVVTLRRSPSPSILINATHALGLLAIAVAIADRWPDLPAGYWLLISLGFTWLEWGLSLGDRYQPWRRSAWYFGCVLAGLSYFNLLAALDRDLLSASWSVAGLALPVGLAFVAVRAPERRYGYEFSLLAVGATVPLTLLLPWTRLVGLGTGTFLTGLLSRFWPRRSVTRLSVFFGLGWGAGLIQDVIPGLPKFTGVQWYPIGAIAVLGLWMLQQVLWRRVGSTSADLGEETLGVRLSSLYAQAVRYLGLCAERRAAAGSDG
ncbi:MAG: hypothetical protein HC886_16160 [Leptolyngbyaceae cyanobacterium SM1_1_3]|nr:hypothetical protein [Leptolyngbyaceae cyanobacterium SM1_1_3]